jgi:hypothetical protein
MAKKGKSNAGRKPKDLTDEMQDRFLKAIRLGCPIKDSCGCAGFSEGWFYEQKKKAEEQPKLASSRKFSEFLRRIKEVEGEATNRWLALIEKAAIGGSWHAAAWKLERRRAMFIPKTQLTAEVSLDATVETTSARDRLMDKLAGIAAKAEPGEDTEGDGSG